MSGSECFSFPMDFIKKVTVWSFVSVTLRMLNSLIDFIKKMTVSGSGSKCFSSLLGFIKKVTVRSSANVRIRMLKFFNRFH